MVTKKKSKSKKKAIKKTEKKVTRLKQSRSLNLPKKTGKKATKSKQNRSFKLAKKMADAGLIGNVDSIIKNQAEEIMKWDDPALDALEELTNKNETKRFENLKNLEAAVDFDRNKVEKNLYISEIETTEMAKKLEKEKVPPYSKSSYSRFDPITPGGHNTRSNEEIENSYNLVYGDLFDGSEKNSEMVAYIKSQDALNKVTQYEDMVAEATKEYWQAKRKLLILTKVISAAYKSIENTDIDTNAKMPTPKEVNNILTDFLKKEMPFTIDKPESVRA